MRNRELRWLVLGLLVGCGGKSEIVSDASVEDTSVDAPDFSSCSGPGTCVVVPASCCGTCGAAVPTDMIGVAESSASAYRSSVCAPGTGCTACFARTDPFLHAFCTAGRCSAVNLHVDALTKCSTDADCQLRYDSCCERCDGSPEGVIALRSDRLSDYRDRVCAPSTACPKCATRYPDGARAVCDPTGHCNVTGIAPF